MIVWVMCAEGVSFHHALEMLKRDHFPLAADPDESGQRPVKQSTVRKLPPLIDARAEDNKLLEIVVSYYHETLKKAPEAQQYLVKRGLAIGGDGRAFPAWLRQPHAELRICRRRTAWTARRSGRG